MKSTIHIHTRAFTLVELLVTMGLMAMLATIAIVGYYGAVRGMTERGAKQDVASLVRLAQQRALVDEVPTAVFLMNQKLRDDNLDTGEAERIVGLAVAVRMAGRISMIKNDVLIDEYSDWRNSFPETGTSSARGTRMRLYRLVDVGSGSSQDSSCYSVVDDHVTPVELDAEELLMASISTNNLVVYGFKKRSGGSAAWKVGDPYGFEIATVQLPAGYIFEGGRPSQVGDVLPAKHFFFFPDKLNASEYKGSAFSFNDIKIQAYRPGSSSPKTVETIRGNNLNDDSDT